MKRTVLMLVVRVRVFVFVFVYVCHFANCMLLLIFLRGAKFVWIRWIAVNFQIFCVCHMEATLNICRMLISNSNRNCEQSVYYSNILYLLKWPFANNLVTIKGQWHSSLGSVYFTMPMQTQYFGWWWWWWLCSALLYCAIS